jgi:hypothetical protein
MSKPFAFQDMILSVLAIFICLEFVVAGFVVSLSSFFTRSLIFENTPQNINNDIDKRPATL